MPIHVNSGFRGTKLPRLEGENEDVFPGTPLAVIGLMMEMLRARFAPDAGHPLPWIWAENMRPENAEDGETLPEGSPRKLMIESAYNVEKSARNYCPAIYVGRNGGPITAAPSGTGDFVGEKKQVQFRAYHCYANMPITCECESENSGESSTIAEITWAYFLMARQIIREEFGFQVVTHAILGDTIPVERTKSIWSTPVQFQVTFDLRWGTIPHAPILRDIGTRLRGRKGAEGYLTSLALHD